MARHNREAFTDGACMTLFWPAHLPSDADQRWRDDPMAQIEQLANAGRLLLFPCDSDGTYTLSIFINEPVAAELTPLLEPTAPVPTLHAHGVAYFAGAEDVDPLIGNDPQAVPSYLTPVDIPAGSYQATLWRTNERAGGKIKRELHDTTTRADRNLERLHIGLQIVAVVGFFVVLPLACIIPWQIWIIPFALWLITCIAGTRTRRIPGVKRVTAARSNAMAKFPDYVVLLQSADTTQTEATRIDADDA